MNYTLKVTYPNTLLKSLTINIMVTPLKKLYTHSIVVLFVNLNIFIHIKKVIYMLVYKSW